MPCAVIESGRSPPAASATSPNRSTPGRSAMSCVRTCSWVLLPKTKRLEPVTIRLAPAYGERGEALSHLAALEHLNQMIAGFASMVSHETRSALVGIQGWSELIRDGGISDDEIRSCASDIFDGAQRIEKMIGQMFDLNHLETRQVA